MAKKALNEMSFLDHLEELRWLLVRSSAAIVIMGIVSYFFADYIFSDLIPSPATGSGIKNPKFSAGYR